MERGFIMIRKIITFPFNVLATILALPMVLCIRAMEKDRWIERKIDIFEMSKKKKNRRK